MHSKRHCFACLTPTAATIHVRTGLVTVCATPVQVRGNDAFKRGVQLRKKFYLREAADLYTQGLAANGSDAALDAVLYANRAEVSKSKDARPIPSCVVR